MENRKQDFLSIIREYESAIEALTTQIDFYAHEQEHLRQEISSLVNENKKLSKALSDIMETKQSLQNIKKQNLDNNLVDNLKKQLSLTLQEKDTVVQLWQNSLKNIDYLEEELRVFTGKTQGFFSKDQIRTKYENHIKNLEEQLAKLHHKIQTILKMSSKTLEDKNFDLERAFRSQKNAVDQIHALEDEVKELQNKIKDIMKIRNKLEVSLKHKNKIIDELKNQMKESKEKVVEAVQVVEAAFREKDAALLRENKVKEEMASISKTLSDVLDETSNKIKNDASVIKQECDSKIKQAQTQIDALKEELNNNKIELQKSLYEYKLLQSDFEKTKRGTLCLDERYTSKMLFFDNNLETMFQKLLSSEKNVIKIEAEKEKILSDMQKLTTTYHSDLKRYQTENESVKKELKLFKKKLKKCQRDLKHATEEATKLKLTIHTIESKENFVETKLRSYLDKEINLNKKWKKGMRDLVEKYETQVGNLKSVNKTLRHKLKRTLKEVLCRNHAKSEAYSKKDSKTNEENNVKKHSN